MKNLIEKFKIVVYGLKNDQYPPIWQKKNFP